MKKVHFALLAACAFVAAPVAIAQVVPAPPSPVIGSSNPVSAEPLVPRPSTTPCTVQLFTNQEFADFNGKPYSYTPPSGCKGPWAKVVFTADFTVTAGIQYDRTAYFLLGGVPIFFGTTAEPSPDFSPSWHVEKDLTDYSALLKSSQSGVANIGNLVNSTYTGIIYANAALEFYPVASGATAPTTPDLVLAVPSSGPQGVNTGANSLTRSGVLPRNMERAYLDIYAQSQGNDEFWYTCVPNSVSSELDSCGGGAFRETQVTLDGVAAAIAPVFPWIYTGGIDPYLWIPTPGVQTLDFKPYRVDLTPFVGAGNDGHTHTLGVSVYGANGSFTLGAVLFVYLDHGSSVVSGALTQHTFSSAPDPSVSTNLNTDPSGNITGTVNTSSNRLYITSGYVNTSHGRVTTTVQSNVSFSNDQTFDITASEYVQDIQQMTQVLDSTTVATSAGSTTSQTVTNYPFSANIDEVVEQSGDIDQTTTIGQEDLNGNVSNNQLTAPFTAEYVSTTDTLEFDSSFNLIGATGGNSLAAYESAQGLNTCVLDYITSSAYAVTGAETSPLCMGPEAASTFRMKPLAAAHGARTYMPLLKPRFHGGFLKQEQK